MRCDVLDGDGWSPAEFGGKLFKLACLRRGLVASGDKPGAAAIRSRDKTRNEHRSGEERKRSVGVQAVGFDLRKALEV